MIAKIAIGSKLYYNGGMDKLFTQSLKLVVASLLVMGALCDVAAESTSGEDSILPGNVNIKVSGETLEPQTIDVNPGTTIVWINNSGKSIKVRFIDKAVSTTCKAPRGFKVGRSGIFESIELGDGQVASLCFLEPERYQYTVDLRSTQVIGDSLAGNMAENVVEHLQGSVSVLK